MQLNIPAHNPITSAGADSRFWESVVSQLRMGVAIYEPVTERGEDGANRVAFRFVSMNPEALRIAEVTADEVVGRMLLDVFPGADDMGFVAALERVYATGNDESLPPLHYVDEQRDGWYRNDIHRLDDGRLMAVYVDVSDDVDAQLALAESDTRYSLLTESLADGIYDWDLEAKTLYLSPSWKAQLGYANDELESRLSVWEEFLHPDQRDRVLGDLQTFLASDSTVWDAEFQLQHKDQHYIWIHSRATAIRDRDTGHVTRILGVHSDIDEKMRRRLEADQHRATLDALFAAMPDLFFLLDEDGTILDFHANEGAELYRAPEEFLGQQMQSMLPPQVGELIRDALRETKQSGELVTIEYSLPALGGEQYFEGRIKASGSRNFAVIVRNITQRRIAEHDLEVRVRENEALSRLHSVIQRARDTKALFHTALEPVAEAMRNPDNVIVAIEIDGRREERGELAAPGRRLTSPVFDGRRTRGQLEVCFDESSSELREEQGFLNAAARAIGVWLRGDDARRGLETYERIVAHTQDKLALLDEDLHFRLVNNAYAALVGRKSSEFRGRPISEVFGEVRMKRQEPRLRRALSGSIVQFQEWREYPQGRRFMNIVYSPYFEDGEVRGVIISADDISELHEAQEQLRRAARVFSSSAEAVLMTDTDGTITDVNAAFLDISGFSEAEVIGLNPSFLASGRHERGFFDQVFREIAKTGNWRGEIWNRRKNGDHFPCLMTISRVEDDDGKLTGYVGVFSDITAIKEHEQYLETLANQDALTGLPNRAKLLRHLNNRVRRDRTPPSPFTVMFIDLDRFKNVNDSLGHIAGDKLLREVATRLEGALRVDDLIARVGGDEFVAVLPGDPISTNAPVIAEKIIDTLAEPFTLNGEHVRIGTSIGICSYPEDGGDSEALLQNADLAMYEAKSSGRNTWRCYATEMSDGVQSHWRMLGELSGAVERGELSLVYLPEYDVASGAMVGIETLMRWDHPELGQVDPSRFIAAAEQGGLIRDLDYWAIDRLCLQLRRWLDDGINAPRASVNVSSRTLGDPRFVQHLRESLNAHAIDGCRLVLELSESTVLTGDSDRLDHLEALGELGVEILIDNFGTGYSSLTRLTRLPLRAVKIDASFVRDATREPLAETVVETIIAMGRSLGVDVVAEGVEDEEHAHFFEKLAPLNVQGFYYRTPLDPESCTELLARTAAEGVS